MLKETITAACLCAATIAKADSARLFGQEITDLIAGATVEIDTSLGTKLPIRYTVDGKLSGQARDLASYLGAASDTGRWWVASDQLCHRWNRWFDSQPQCLRLSKEGRTIHWRSQDGNSGTAVIAVPAPIQTASVLPHAQVDSKMHIAAPASPTTPANSFMAAQPADTPAGVDQSSRSANEKPVADIPSVDPAVAQVPGTLVENFRPRLEPKRPAEPAYIVANVARGDVLNVRSGPSTDFDVVGELQPGSRSVSITGACKSDWCPVQHQSTSGWVNRMYLANEGSLSTGPLPWRISSIEDLLAVDGAQARPALRDPSDAPRTCLTPPARALLERIEEKFGPVKLVSTCRPGAKIAGSWRPSRHASGNAVDFDADHRKADIVEWLITNHHDGGTMTYSGMDHIHVDIGPHFVSIAGGRHWASWRDHAREFPGHVARTSSGD
jgi:Bacterial SH3 domain/Peptidase M15